MTEPICTCGSMVIDCELHEPDGKSPERVAQLVQEAEQRAIDEGRMSRPAKKKGRSSGK